MEPFDSTKSTIRKLLKNESYEQDRGKNFYIPPYQRPYDWTEDEVKKLIVDIFDELENKTDAGYSPYFIGGIVLSHQSMMGEERSKKSLEVIDGQQRLTTIVLILASIVQILKFQDRDFINKENAAQHLINDISNLLKIKSLNVNTMQVEEKYILERSDKSSDDFAKLIYILLERKINESLDLEEELKKNEDSKKLITIVIKILTTLSAYDDDELIDFTIQLLNNTWIVVTKTLSIETGFSIFEKLNDSGIPLEAQDLLKNYLFRTTSDEEYTTLSERWDDFLKKIKLINTGKAKMFPKEFLEQYLTITGNAPKILGKGKKEKLFDKYKELHSDSFESTMELLDDLILMAEEYRNIKCNDFSSYLNTINFKLGYLIVLSFYKKYGNDYKNYQNEILSMTMRLGITYLIIGQSTGLSAVIPGICLEVINQNHNIEEAINNVNIYINKLLIKKESDFDEVVSNTNVFRKKPLVRLLLRTIEFHLTNQKLDNYIPVLQIMPSEYYESCSYIDIIDDTCTKYSNYIGNLLLNNGAYKISQEKCFSERYLQFCTNDDLDVNKIMQVNFDTQNINITAQIAKEGWGKDTIIERSQAIAKIANFIIIQDNLKKDFFN